MWRDVILAALGATGFAIIFGIRRRKLIIIFLASGAAWYGYGILCKLIAKENIAIFLITVLVVLFARVITLFLEEPTMLFSTPILIPFIPGASLYYVMNDLLSKNPAFVSDMESLVNQLGAMVLGIAAAEMLVVVVRKIKRKIGWDSIVHKV
ncbi:MAG: threonine/serine exporter family protein [Lachnospiraceae bacterium]